MNAAFLAAAAPQAHRVLGLRLEPLSIGHIFLMEQHGCAFALNGNATIEDLFLAVFICSQKPSEFTKSKIAIGLFTRFLRWKNRKAIITVELLKFRAYFNYHRQIPSANVDPNGRHMGTPEHWRLLVMLMSQFGMSRELAMDTGLIFASCLWASEGERQNSFQVLTHEQASAMRELVKESRK